MRYDDLNAPADQPAERAYPPLPVNRGAAERPTPEPVLADREVPLTGGSAAFVLDQWLDGEASSVAVQATSGGNDALELWNRINDEADLLRSRKTPLYVHKRIMESLPEDMYRLNGPWYRRPVALNPILMAAAATALVGIGALVMRLVLH